MANAVSRAVIEVLLDRVHQGVATISSEGQLTYVNQRLASMLGKSRAQLVGRPLAELVAEPDREALAGALAMGRDTASQCRLAMPRGNGNGGLQALVTFAPLGHGQASCLVTDLSAKNGGMLEHEVRNMLGALRHALGVLTRSPPDADAERALDSIERHSARILEVLNSKQ